MHKRVTILPVQAAVPNLEQVVRTPSGPAAQLSAGCLTSGMTLTVASLPVTERSWPSTVLIPEIVSRVDDRRTGSSSMAEDGAIQVDGLIDSAFFQLLVRLFT